MPNRKRPTEAVLELPAMESESEEPEFYDVELEYASAAFAKDIDKSLRRYGFTMFHSLSPEQQTKVLRHMNLETDSPRDHFNFGRLAIDEGRIADAIVNFQNALKADPTLTDAAWNLALALEKNGDKAAARQQWEAALELGFTDAEKAAIEEYIKTLA